MNTNEEIVKTMVFFRDEFTSSYKERERLKGENEALKARVHCQKEVIDMLRPALVSINSIVKQMDKHSGMRRYKEDEHRTVVPVQEGLFDELLELLDGLKGELE